uniref:Uncharacterized protein n=1 Tax=Anopheles coluzzii TaxID=1518534 RepID=A0A8W7PX90_ANOCL
MDQPAASLTGSVFPVRPSLDHLLAMGEDDDDDDEVEGACEEEMQKKPDLVVPGAVPDRCSPVLETVPEQEADGEDPAAAADEEDDDDGASEMTELQQLPDTQQSAGAAKEQKIDPCKTEVETEHRTAPPGV